MTAYDKQDISASQKPLSIEKMNVCSLYENGKTDKCEWVTRDCDISGSDIVYNLTHSNL